MALSGSERLRREHRDDYATHDERVGATDDTGDQQADSDEDE